ncbi:hypothetical protein ID866_1174 [Astraeus odoratus]|nr:hypothetical protein ID866_1174 [Astraeus odoratus]
MHIFTRAPLEGMILYLAPYWAGVLTNITTAHIPIYRLTASDIMQQPGGLTALIIIVLIVLVFVLNQVRVIRKTGWLPVYLAWYVAGGLVALAMTLLSGLQFRLHHYIISMVLLPGTGFPTRLSAIYQGFLLGMFLNGVAAFGFDSILQTMADLVGDEPAGSPLPELLTNSTTYDATIPLVNQTIFWADIPDFVAAGGWSGFSLLVDDVERYTGSALNYSLAELDAGLPHFFRLARGADRYAAFIGVDNGSLKSDEARMNSGDDITWTTDPEHRLTSERLRQWGMYAHVDHVFDLVPFWRRAVFAAEKGEELRLADFLDKMEEGGGWRTASDVWNLLGTQQRSRGTASDVTQVDEPDKGWGIAEDWALAERGSQGWGIAADNGWGMEDWAMSEHGGEECSAPVGCAQHPLLGQSRDGAMWNDDGVQLGQTVSDSDDFVDRVAHQSAVSEERRRQMHKFFQMPTEQKIQEIQRTIRFLQTQH